MIPRPEDCEFDLETLKTWAFRAARSDGPERTRAFNVDRDWLFVFSQLVANEVRAKLVAQKGNNNGDQVPTQDPPGTPADPPMATVAEGQDHDRTGPAGSAQTATDVVA